MSRMAPSRTGQGRLLALLPRGSPLPSTAGRAGGFLALPRSSGQRQALGDYTSVTVLLPLQLPEGTARAGRELSLPPQQGCTSSLEVLTRQKPADPSSITTFRPFKPFLGHDDFWKLRAGAVLQRPSSPTKEQPRAGQGTGQVNTWA